MPPAACVSTKCSRFATADQRALRRRRAPDAPTRLDADLPCGGGGRLAAGLLPAPTAPRGERFAEAMPSITLRPRRGARLAAVAATARDVAEGLRAAAAASFGVRVRALRGDLGA